MSDRLGPMPLDRLEARLFDLASALDFPPTPDLATAVAARLRAQTVTVERPRPRRLPVQRSVRRSLLLAAALGLLVVGTVVAVGFGLRLLSIESRPLPTHTPAPATPFASGALGAGLDLGRPLTLEQVAADADFDVLLPEGLGVPDAAYLGGAALRGQVAFVYAPRDDLPESSLLEGAGLLVTQNRGVADEGLAQKIVDSSDATVEAVDVGGSPGIWISGEPHVFWYMAPDGTFVQESRRVVGDTLAWERDGVLYRIEGAITLERALEIATSMR